MHFSCGIVRPPYEAGSCFLQVTSGCSHNKCRFCTFYKEAPFFVSPESEIREDLQEIRDSGCFVGALEINTILDATNVSNMAPVFGCLPDDKDAILEKLRNTIEKAGEERLQNHRKNMRSL